MVRRLTLTESGPARSIQISDEIATAAVASGLVSAARTATVGLWSLRADRKVGTIRVGDDLEVTVVPKVAIGRLVFMLGYARNPDFWRNDPVPLPQHEGIPEVLAHTFARLATRATEQGLLQGYRTVDDGLTVVRGRIRADDQLRLRFGMPLPMEVRYDEYSVDIAENRLLLAAVLRLLRGPRIDGQAYGILQGLRRALASVTPPTPGQPSPAWQSSRLNSRYVPALRIAEMILDDASFEQRGGREEVPVDGFILDTWRVFEDFVCVALAQHMPAASGRAELQHQSYLDAEASILLKPDFTWWHGEHIAAVVDAKYKAASGSLPNSDIYQMLAYCTAYGLCHGHLVYPIGEAQPSPHRILRSPIVVHRHGIDLGVPARDLLSQIKAISARIDALPSVA